MQAPLMIHQVQFSACLCFIRLMQRLYVHMLLLQEVSAWLCLLQNLQGVYSTFLC